MPAEVNFHAFGRLAMVVAALSTGLAPATEAGADVQDARAGAAARAEANHNLPAGLPASIAVTEAGRWVAARQSTVA